MESRSRIAVLLRLKEKEMIQLISSIPPVSGTAERQEQNRALEVAITHLQTARMWAVRATYNDSNDFLPIEPPKPVAVPPPPKAAETRPAAGRWVPFSPRPQR